MKISNLITVFALMLSFSLHSQSNTSRVVSVDNDDKTIHIEYEDGEVSILKVDGETIKKSDYSKYQHIFDKYKYQSKSDDHSTYEMDEGNDIQSILLEKLKAYLLENKNISSNKFKFKLTSSSMWVNGNKLSNNKLNDCLEIFDETVGYSLNKGSHFKVDIAPGIRSISLSIID